MQQLYCAPPPLSTQLMPRAGSPRRRWQAAEYILSEHVERHTPRSARHCGGEREATPALKTLPFPASKSFWDCAELLLERGVCVVDGQALVVEGSGADAQAEQVLALGAQVCHAAHAGAQQHLRGSRSHTTRCMYALTRGGGHTLYSSELGISFSSSILFQTAFFVWLPPPHKLARSNATESVRWAAVAWVSMYSTTMVRTCCTCVTEHINM